ncbi:MAG: DUF192 domain-containing protein [Phycisphaerales bacterium]
MASQSVLTSGGGWWRWVLVLAAAGAVFAVAFANSCDEKASASVQSVKLNDKWFHLEIAATEPVRMKGLGQRTDIEPDGGMLFLFPQPVLTGFVMRDCLTDIDIIYIDPSGRIAAMYEMKKEPPRNPADGEGEVGDFSNRKYNDRLKQYPSRFAIQYVIELKGGTLPTLGLKEGDHVDLPYARLKALAE